jgi:hypothetical protein
MSSVVPGYPTFTEFTGSQESTIPVAGATSSFTYSGGPIAGDVVHVALQFDGEAAPGTDTIDVTVGATPTDTTVAAAVVSAITGDASYTALLSAGNVAGKVTLTLVSAQRPDWASYAVDLSVTPAVGSTLEVAPNPALFTPNSDSGLVSVTALVTFPYSANGQQMTFYKGQVIELPIYLAQELVEAGLAQ